MPPRTRKNPRRSLLKSQRTSIQTLATNILSKKKSNEEDFGFALRNFLDGYYSASTQEKQRLLRKEPQRISNVLKDQGVADAYLAALAVQLSRQDRIPTPSWALKKWRIPEKPWFALSSPEARMWLITESPAPFRERHLFISADALSRA